MNDVENFKNILTYSFFKPTKNNYNNDEYNSFRFLVY